MKFPIFFLFIACTLESIALSSNLTNRSMIFLEGDGLNYKVTMLSSRKLFDDALKLDEQSFSSETGNLSLYFGKTLGISKFQTGENTCLWTHVKGNINKDALYLQSSLSCQKDHPYIKWNLKFFSNFPKNHQILVSFIHQNDTFQQVLTPDATEFYFHPSTYQNNLTEGLAFIGVTPSAWIDNVPIGIWIIIFCLIIICGRQSRVNSPIYLIVYVVSLFSSILVSTTLTFSRDSPWTVMLLIFSGGYYLWASNRQSALHFPFLTLSSIGFLHGLMIYQHLPLAVQSLPLKSLLTGFQLGALIGLIVSLVVLWPIIKWTLIALPEREIFPKILSVILFITGSFCLLLSI